MVKCYTSGIKLTKKLCSYIKIEPALRKPGRSSSFRANFRWESVRMSETYEKINNRSSSKHAVIEKLHVVKVGAGVKITELKMRPNYTF